MRTRWIAIFALAAMLALLFASALAIPARPAEFAWVVDETGTLSQQDKDEIFAYGEALLEATGAQPDGDQLVALIVEFLDGMDPADYVTQVINTWGLGDNSLLILLATGDRAIEIGAGRGIDRLFSAAQRGALIDTHLDDFANNRFAKGMVGLYADVAERTAQLRGKTLRLTRPGAPSLPIQQVQEETEERKEGSGVGMVLLIPLLLLVLVISIARSDGSRRQSRRSYGGASRVPPAPYTPMRGADWRVAPPPPPTPRRSTAGRVVGTIGRVAAASLLEAANRSTTRRSSGWSSSGRSSSSFGSSSRSSGSFRSGGSRGSSAGRRF